MSIIEMEMPKENLDPKISMPLSEYVKRILDTRDETIDRVLKNIEERSYGGVNINYSQIKSDVLRIKTHWVPLLNLELDASEIKAERRTNEQKEYDDGVAILREHGYFIDPYSGEMYKTEKST